QQLPTDAQPKANDGSSANLHGLVDPLSAARIPSAEMQFGAAGSNEQTRTLVNDGRIRRLPVVAPIETRLAVAPTVGKGIFAAPPSITPLDPPVDSNTLRTAERASNNSIWH